MAFLTSLGLFLAGILAGIELVVRYGIHPALMRLSERSHLEARHEIVRVIRVIVPAVLLPSVLVGVAVAVLSASDRGTTFRWAAVGTYAVYLLVVFLGTVPINDRFFEWNVLAPPAHWRKVIRRWALIDVVRSSLAIVAFALFIAASSLG